MVCVSFYLKKNLPFLELIVECETAYARGFQLAQRQTESSSASRLDLILSYSKFCGEILDDLPRAVELAQKGSNDALTDFNRLDEDANLILDILRNEISVS
jgi:hypothetical protein